MVKWVRRQTKVLANVPTVLENAWECLVVCDLILFVR